MPGWRHPPDGLGPVSQVATDWGSGGSRARAVKADGTVDGWPAAFQSPTTAIPDGLNGVRAVALAAFDGLALKWDGTVVEWGGSGLARRRPG
jgi:hypothetical protein